jgi:hypothetical protein
MNLKTTLALIVLAGCALAAALIRGDLRDPYGYIPAPQARSDKEEKALSLPPAKALAAITIESGDEKTQLTRGPSGAWVMPGNWPTREAKVQELVGALGSLSSRFQPDEPDDWAPYGLDHPAARVTITPAGGKPIVLDFGTGPIAGQTRFDRPTWLRVNNGRQAWRLSPGLASLLSRPADYYMQRRLFPSVRELKEEGSVARAPRLDAKSLSVEEKGEKLFEVRKAASGWELSYPIRDALDPQTRDRLLEAAADLWAEKFIGAPKEFKPERVITVDTGGGHLTVLEVGPDLPGGKPPPIPLPGMPEEKERKRAVARLRGYDRYFEVDTTGMSALTPDLASLRESQLARFRSEDVKELTIQTSKGKVVLRNESKPKEMPDDPPPPPEWKVVAPIQAPADSQAVDRVVNALTSLNAVDRDAGMKTRLGAAAAALGVGPLGAAWLLGADRAEGYLGMATPGATLTAVVSEGPEKQKKQRTVVVRLGRHDAAGKKLYATSGDWPRVNEVSDELAGLVLGKGTLDFRGKKLLDGHSSDLRSVKVERVDLSPLAGLGAGPLAAIGLAAANQTGSFELQRDKEGDWAMTAPVKASADQGRAAELASKLAGLEVAAWVADIAEPGAYGLDTPTLRATFAYDGDKKPARRLIVGAPRPEGGFFAKLADAPEVFALSRESFDVLGRGSLMYRPRSLWSIAPGDDPVEFAITRPGQPELKVVRKGDAWEVTGAFTVAAPREMADALVSALRSPQAESYLAHEAAADAYGLANPRLTLTVKTKMGKEHTLTLGQGRVGRLGKEPAVFTVTEEVARAADQSALDFLDRALFKLDAQQATSISRTQGAEAFEAVKKDDAWEMTRPSAQPCDEKRVTDLVKLVAGLRAEKFAAYGAKDLKPFGLDTPAAVITVKSPEEAVLLIGSELPGGARHAQVKGSPAVAVLSAADVKKLLASTLSFRDHLLARLPDADEASVTAGARSVTFAKPEGTWKLSKPISAEADHDALEGLLNSLARLRADEMVAEKPDAAALKKFGLDRPAAAWSFRSGGKVALRLDVGSEEPGGVRRYARLAGNDLVFLLDARLSSQLTSELRPRTVFKSEVDPAQVEEVRFGYAEGAFTLKKSDGEWKLDGKPDVKVNKAALTDALSALRGLKLERYVVDDGADLKLYGLAPPFLTLEVTTPSGKQTLLIGGAQGGSGRRYGKHPGKDTAVFVLSEADSIKLVRTLAELTAK